MQYIGAIASYFTQLGVKPTVRYTAFLRQKRKKNTTHYAFINCLELLRAFENQQVACNTGTSTVSVRASRQLTLSTWISRNSRSKVSVDCIRIQQLVLVSKATAVTWHTMSRMSTSSSSTSSSRASSSRASSSTVGAADTGTDVTYKVLLLGDTGVGKTSLIRALTGKPFSHSLVTTVGNTLDHSFVPVIKVRIGYKRAYIWSVQSGSPNWWCIGLYLMPGFIYTSVRRRGKNIDSSSKSNPLRRRGKNYDASTWRRRRLSLIHISEPTRPY